MAQDILITPGSGEPQILFRGSGTNDTPIELNVLSSYQSANGSGTALLFEGTEGQLFAITDNLSSGVIFSVAGAAGLPFIEADASGDVRLIEYGRYVGVGTGTPAYQLDVFGTGRFSEGILFADGNIQTGAYTGDGGGGGSSPTGTASGIAFFGDDNLLTEDSNFYWNTGSQVLRLSAGSPPDGTSLFFGDNYYISKANVRLMFSAGGSNPAAAILNDSGKGRLSLGADGYLSWTNSAGTPHASPDLTIYRDEANTLAQRRGSQAQEFRIYHSGDTSNYERLSIKATGYNYEISPQVNGGTAGSVIITNDTSTVQTLIVRGAASQSANLQEWQTSAGSIRLALDEDGVFQTSTPISAVFIRDSQRSNCLGFPDGNLCISQETTFTNGVTVRDGGATVNRNRGFYWNNGTLLYGGGPDTALLRPSAGNVILVSGGGSSSPLGHLSVTGITLESVYFADGTTQTTASTPGGSDTNIQFNNGGTFSGESNFTWNYNTDLLTVSGTSLLAGTGVVLQVKNTGGDTLFAVEDTNETTVVVNAQVGQTSYPFEVRDEFSITAAYVDVSGNVSGNSISFGDGTTQTTAATASGPASVISDTGTGITMVCGTHANNYLRTTSNSAVTITFPSGLGCDANSEFTFEQAGSGQITVTGDAGVTINTSSTTKSYTQFSVISMKQVTTDTYTLFGDTASF